jgi:hypothetical protein
MDDGEAGYLGPRRCRNRLFPSRYDARVRSRPAGGSPADAGSPHGQTSHSVGEIEGEEECIGEFPNPEVLDTYQVSAG